MAKKEQGDEERERRISMEIIVDPYDEDERAMGWYNYLVDTLQFPFTATCIAKRAISPLKIGDEVDVIDMPNEDECRAGSVCHDSLGKGWAGSASHAVTTH